MTGEPTRAGEYELPPGTTPRSLLRLFESGAVVQHPVTIVEGWTFRDLRGALEREPRASLQQLRDLRGHVVALGKLSSQSAHGVFPS